MRLEDRRTVIEELKWHCDRPRVVAMLLTEEEAADIVKKGFVAKDLWRSLELRLAASEAE